METEKMSATPKCIAIVGGHGKVALQLIPQLLGNGKNVVALARREAQRADLESMGATARHLDIETATEAEFAESFAGCDAVVFTAGGGPDGNISRKTSVDLEGSLKSIAGARAAGIERFIQVSAIGVDNPLPEDTTDVWRAYVEAKRDADAALRDSNLAWTVLRPGRLTDDPGNGLVELADQVPRGSIPRADVAAVIVELLERPETVGKQWELISGTVPVREAVTAALS